VIKIVFCLRRLPTVSPEEFYRYWLENHGPLVRSHAATLRIRRYTQGHTAADPRLAPAVSARGCEVPPYDGVAELYWNSIEDLVEAASSPEGLAAGGALLRAQVHRSAEFVAVLCSRARDRAGVSFLGGRSDRVGDPRYQLTGQPVDHVAAWKDSSKLSYPARRIVPTSSAKTP
jgi:uncharacterized protein (TIGR02118 family)